VTCREFAEFMAEYLSGDVPGDTRREFERHLAVCKNCQRYLMSYVESIKLGRGAFAEESDALPGDVPEDLVKAVLAARERMTE